MVLMGNRDGKVVRQNAADARNKRQDLVRDVGEPACHGRLRNRSLEDLGDIAVLDNKVATLVLRGETDDKSAKHAGDLFRVGVGLEHGALLVNQHLVELGRHRDGNAQLLGDPFASGLHGGPPLGAEIKLSGIQLPRVADCCINKRFATSAVGGLARFLNQLLNRRSPQREGYTSDIVDRDRLDVVWSDSAECRKASRRFDCIQCRAESLDRAGWLSRGDGCVHCGR